MADFLDELHERMTQSADEIRHRERRDEEAKLRLEHMRVSRMHDLDVLREELKTARERTLDLAWAAAQLLAQEGAGAPLTYWTSTELPPRRSLLALKKPEPRHTLVQEGWPLSKWRVRYPQPSLATLVLTRQPDARGSHLATVQQILKRTTLGEDDVEDAREEDVAYLGLRPLERERTQWPTTWPTPESLFTHSGTTLQVVRDHEQEMLDNPTGEYEVSYHLMSTLRAYQDANIEESIRRDIGRVSAKYLIVEPEKASMQALTRTSAPRSDA